MLAAVAVGIVAHFALVYVPFLQQIFKTQALGPRALAMALGAAGVIILAAELWKWWMRSRQPSASDTNAN
jgi:Ca2+-transporting ATPase